MKAKRKRFKKEKKMKEKKRIFLPAYDARELNQRAMKKKDIFFLVKENFEREGKSKVNRASRRENRFFSLALHCDA